MSALTELTLVGVFAVAVLAMTFWGISAARQRRAAYEAMSVAEQIAYDQNRAAQQKRADERFFYPIGAFALFAASIVGLVLFIAIVKWIWLAV